MPNSLVSAIDSAKQGKDATPRQLLSSKGLSSTVFELKRCEAKIAGDTTPANAYNNMYLLAPRARRAKRKPPQLQLSRTDSSREAAPLCSQFASFQTFPRHKTPPEFPETTATPTHDPLIFYGYILDSITPEIIKQAIFKPAPNSSSGLDGITPGLLRHVWNTRNGQTSLQHIVRISIGRGLIPPSWKLALVNPLPKTKPGDYRPISLLSQMSKVCERIVAWTLTEEVSLTHAQFGGRGLLSAIDAARLAHHASVQASHRNKFLLACFLDMTKAYDRVVPQILIQDLLKQGVPMEIAHWIKTWLSDRSIQVRMKGCISDLQKVNCGVPQGSPLSVILFLIYINSIPINPDRDLLFVDDCALLVEASSVNEAEALLQEDLHRIEDWARARNISFNPEKSVLLPLHKTGSFKISIHFFDFPLPMRYEATYLGIKFQTSTRPTLGWKLDGHHKDICKKISQKSAIFRFLRSGFLRLSFGTLRLLFMGWIQGIISYSNPILAHLLHDLAFEKTYRKCLRDLTGLHHDTPNSIVYSVAGLSPLFHLHHARAELNAVRLLFLSPYHPLAVRFWGWIDTEDPDHAVRAATSFTEERDFLRGHPQTDLENPMIRSHYQLPTSGTAYTPLQLLQVSLAPNPGPPAEISIWTDGSYDDSLKLGAGACLILDQHGNSLHTENCTKSFVVSSTSAEYIGLQLGLDWAAKHCTGQTINVYCDSAAALRSLSCGLGSPSHSLLREHARLALLRTTACNEVHLIHVPGHAGILHNEIVDKHAKEALRTARKPLPAHDESWFRLNASSFLSSPPDYALSPRIPTNLPVPTKASLARLSAGLATFIYQMIHDCGHTQERLYRHKRADSSLCRHCKTSPETPSHLWTCLGPAPELDFGVFCLQPDGERARQWLFSLRKNGVTL